MQNLRPLTIGELLDAAFRIYRGRAKTLMMAVAVPMVPMLVLQTLVSWSTQPENYDPFDFSSAQQSVEPGEALLQLTGTLLSSMAIVLASALATAACFRAVSDAYVGEPVTWRESLSFAKTRIWGVLGLTILVGLATLLGLVLCIVPVIVPMAWFSVAVPVLLMEGTGVGRAMGRSRALVSGRFWPVLGAVLLSALLASILQGIIATPAFVAYIADLPTVAALIVEAVFSGIGLILVTPFTAAFTMALYVDLRVRKEGFDIYLWAQRLGVDATPDGRTQPGTSSFGPAAGFAPPPPPSMGPVSSLPPPPGHGPTLLPPPAPPPPAPSSWPTPPEHPGTNTDNEGPGAPL